MRTIYLTEEQMNYIIDRAVIEHEIFLESLGEMKWQNVQ